MEEGESTMGQLVVWIDQVKKLDIPVTSTTRIGVREDGVLLWGRNVPAPGPPPSPAGKWAKQIVSAALMNERNSSGLYCAPSQSLFIEKGSNHYYLIDPKGFGVPFTWGIFRVGLTVSDQTNPCSIQIMLYRVTRNGDELSSTPITGSGDYSQAIRGITQAEWESNLWLLEVKEMGVGSGSFNMIYWNPGS